MSDKRGPSREHERFPAQQEHIKPVERNLDKERVDLFKSIDPAKQMPKNNQEVINKMLTACEKGKCRSQEQLSGYQPFASGKFEDPNDVHPGHIAYLYANNLLTEGREVVIGKYEDGYAMYHKKS